MKTTRFNRSQIMKRAWNCYRKHHITMSFGRCLAWSWKKAIEELRKNNPAEYRAYDGEKLAKFKKEYDKYLHARLSAPMGWSNSWANDYGRRVAVRCGARIYN